MRERVRFNRSIRPNSRDARRGPAAMNHGPHMQVVSIELPTPEIIVESQQRREIDSALQPDLTTIRIPTSRPEVLTVPLARPPIKTHSFIFPQPVALRTPPPVAPTSPNSESQLPV